MRGQFLQTKSWVPSSLLCHRLHRAWSVKHIFYTGEVEYLAEVRVMEQILRKFPNSQKFWARTNSVYQALFSPTTHKSLATRLSLFCTLCTVYSVLCTVYSVLCTLYSMYCVLCTLYSMYYVLCTLYAVYSVLCTLYSMYCVLCTLYSMYYVLCTLCAV